MNLQSHLLLTFPSHILFHEPVMLTILVLHSHILLN
ncbi:hypothetical protein Slin15195_G102830 [Septoria linicola]|uniref:Uncharacterized protein n=1 Tax=Septoria linicola TaxID=215465 RepID=A0A9Q9AXN8_9PEZI|nr:hypothetical protein Slin14017_G065830 [Septoria linicola]USW56964.1 hypothetical protein Slin15195_G102830 [Septoria linicola]